MKSNFFNETKWLNALTLSERAAMLGSFGAGRPSRNATAQSRFEKWKKQRPFSNSDIFAQRLGLDGLDEAAFRAILAAPPLRIKQSAPKPDWLTEMESAFKQNKDVVEPDANDNAAAILFRPLLVREERRIARELRRLAADHPGALPDTKKIAWLLGQRAIVQVAQMANRTLALEINVARLRGQLKGETPLERYRYFIKRLTESRNAMPILEEYSVLTRQVMKTVRTAADTGLEFIGHLCRDRAEMARVFNGGADIGGLEEVDFGAGDTHRGGRSVLIARFSGGLKLVYKPRPLAIDIAFEGFVEWLNRKDGHPGFRSPRAVNFGTHGWVEFAQPDECTSEREVQKCYERMGGWLAILYLLEATDFHAENMIASGEHPILVDLEALFHPRVSSRNGGATGHSGGMGNSVIRVGLLPQKLWIGGEENPDGIDMSGIGCDERQLSPFATPQWVNLNTDEIRLEKMPAYVTGHSNRPRLGGKDTQPLLYLGSVLKGFRQTYRTLLKNRAEMLSEKGPLAAFRDCEIRFIARATRTYATILNESFHPDFLRNALDRDRLLDKLWLETENHPYLGRLIAHERRDLVNGDIPYFYTVPDSSDVFATNGERISGAINSSGWELSMKRIEGMSAADLERQMWYIRASFASLTNEKDKQPMPRTRRKARATAITDPLVMAKKAGDRLIALAESDGGNISWTGVSLVQERVWSISPVGSDLFYGLPGIVHFLAYLGVSFGASPAGRKYTAFAREAHAGLNRKLDGFDSSQLPIGAFDGLGGLLYSNLHLGALWKDAGMIDEAERMAEAIGRSAQNDNAMDVISGSAGAIMSLYALYKYKPSEIVVTAIRKCAERLRKTAVPLAKGVGWSSVVSKVPLSGASHGAAGIAYALLIAAAVCGDNRYLKLAWKGLKYERSLYLPEFANWRDLRKDDPGEEDSSPKFMTAWCHGAAGIGMYRLASASLTYNPMFASEIETAMKTTLATGFGQSHCLCHGDLGNLDLLLQLKTKRGMVSGINRIVERAVSGIIGGLNEYGWVCGIPLNVETPGLMTGLAGIGYGLLRASDPVNVPSVLVMEPPVAG